MSLQNCKYNSLGTTATTMTVAQLQYTTHMHIILQKQNIKLIYSYTKMEHACCIELTTKLHFTTPDNH